MSNVFVYVSPISNIFYAFSFSWIGLSLFAICPKFNYTHYRIFKPHPTRYRRSGAYCFWSACTVCGYHTESFDISQGGAFVFAKTVEILLKNIIIALPFNTCFASRTHNFRTSHYRQPNKGEIYFDVLCSVYTK